MSALADNLKTLRQAKGVYQKDVANWLGIDRTTYVKYERGQSSPDYDILLELANYFSVSVDYLLGKSDVPTAPKKGVKIPVLGRVVAGIPIEAIEDVLDYEEISEDMAAHGEYFALQVVGKSMEPRFAEGDVVIVKRQPDVESGDIAIVLINGDEATIKKVKKLPDGIMLIASNTAVYEPTFYSKKEIDELPVVILGKVVELRAKF